MKRLIGITLRKNLKNSEKPKKRVFSRKVIVFTSLFILLIYGVQAQERGLTADTIPVIQNRADSLKTLPAAQDSLSVNDTIPKSTFETTVKYFAEDSIITKTRTNVTYLYGNAYIEYGDIKLTAERIIIDRNKNELHAMGVQDSLGVWEGRPIFQDGGDRFETEEIRYNFVTQRARISGVAAEQPDGYLRGEVVKRNPDQSAYIKNGRYTPCLDDPNATTYIKAKKIKIIPGKSVITGPFLLYIGDIPTPLGLPFGFFPDTQEATSGILFPKYGDEQRRGLYLRDGGYYQVWSDKLHTALTGDIYSKGSWALNMRNVYKVRYKYSGQLQLSYNRNQTPAYETDGLDSKDFWLTWSHRPESLGRNSRFSAQVNVGTSTYNQNNLNLNNFQSNVRSEFRSNLSYSGTIPGTPFSYSVSGRHSQNIQTNIIDVSLPEFNMSMNRIFPLKRMEPEILKKLSVGWDVNLSNRVTNIVRAPSASYDISNRAEETDTISVGFDTLGELLDNAQNGARMRIPISTGFPILNNLNVSPSFNVEQLWYLKELDYTFIESENAVRIDTLNGFSAATTYSAGVSIGTQLYGTFTNSNPYSKVEAIRHTMTPGISFSYRPDYSQSQYGFYKEVQTDTTDGGRYQLLSIYDGFLYGSPGLGESASLSFNVSNKIEMKVRSDTAKSENKSILDNLSLGGSYNFLADSFALSTISINARTTLFNRKLSVNAGGTLDPYTYSATSSENSTLQRRDIYAWKSGQGIGRLTSARLSLSTNLNSKASSSPNANTRSINNNPMGLGSGYIDDQAGEYGSMNAGGQLSSTMAQYFYDPNAYVDISIPWNVRMSFDYSYSWNPSSGTRTRKSVKMYGQVALTPKWDVTFNSGYDFDAKEPTQTSIGIFRDLGCWQMNASWIPFGVYTSYSIDIQIKASALKDLKLSRRRTQFDN